MPLHLGSVLAGLVTRCPRCWRGRMFRSWFRMRERCEACGYDFGMDQGEFTGAMMMAQFAGARWRSTASGSSPSASRRSHGCRGRGWRSSGCSMGILYAGQELERTAPEG